MATTDLNPEHGARGGEVDLSSSPSTNDSARPGPITRLRDHVRDPMSRSGYSLVLGSAITSALGMGFWILAARLYDARNVGIASALIAAMGFLASASTIGLKNGFIRFLPVAGAAAPRFIRNAYLSCIAVASTAALVFIIGQPVWAGELSMLREGPLPILFFIAATASWTIFVLQDSVLTGLRLASWVPAENAVFAVAKIILLVALVAVPTWGIFVAWSVPAIALLLPVNLLILRRLRSRSAIPRTTDGIAIADVVRFAAGDHVAAFLWLGTTELLSLVVLAQAGAESAAFYFLSFQIAYSLYLVTSNFSSAFVVEAAVHPDQEEALLRRALVQTARLVIPASLLAVVAAPYLLRVIGSEYEANGVPLLRLLLLSALPQILVGVSVGRARLHRHVRVVILVYAVTAVALFSGATFGLRAGGLEAVGWAWLATQLVVATVLTPTVLHPPLGRWLASTLLRPASAAKTGLHQRGRAASARRQVPAALAAAGSEDPTHYTLLPSHHDTIVARGTIDGDPVVMRIAMTGAGATALDDNARMLERLAGHERHAKWGTIVPELLHRDQVDGHDVVVESFLPGHSLDRLDGEQRAAALARAATALGSLHRATSRPGRFDDSVARRWIDEPIEVLEALPTLADRGEELRELQTWLRSELVGRTVDLCWVHGDFWAGNVLVTETSGIQRVTGIIDWENGRSDGFAELDLAHLWLTEHSEEMGATLLAAFERPESWSGATTADDGTCVTRGSGLPAQAVLVLAWLGHVAAGAGRSTDHPPSRVWLRRNVLTVLDRSSHLASGEPSVGGGPVEIGDTFTDEPADGDAAHDEADDAPVPDPTPTGDIPEDPEPARVDVSPDEPDLGLPPGLGPAPVRTNRLSRSDVGAVVVVLAAALSWVLGLWGADPRTMTEVGIISLFTPPMVAALVLLTGGFVVALRRDAPGWVPALHIVVLITLLHATPAVLYETLRYAWAWKHTGIVEFITRTGAVDTTVDITPIYHSWPGFFAGSALLTELAGLRHSVRIAMWAPLAFNLLNLFAMRSLMRSLTASRRVVWLALWLFFITNWVGQDYFSPQAMAFLLYLAMLWVVLRGFRSERATIEVLARPVRPGVASVAFVLIMSTMASSHQITPFLAMVALAGLVLFRQIRGWYLPIFAGASMTVWAFTVGSGETTASTQSLVDSFGRPVSNAEETLQKGAASDASQEVIIQAGRAVVVALGLLAVIGAVRLWRRKALHPALLVIAATPAALPFATEFGGEAVFRVFLFAVPALALLGAAAIDPGVDRPAAGAVLTGAESTRARGVRRSPTWSLPRSVMAFLISASLLGGFVLAYYGKDQQYHFTQEEVDAAEWVAQNGRPGSLLVEGSRNYPTQFLNYENFTYVAIAREPEESRDEVLSDPVRKLSEWLDNEEYSDAYVLITRSQKIAVDLGEPVPQGSIDRVEEQLRGSNRFSVAFQNRDAVVFELARPGGR